VLGLAAVIALSMLVSACGGSSSSSGGPVATAPPPKQPPPTTTAPPVKLVTTVSATVKPGASAKAYTRRVDSILADSKSNLQDLQMYVGLVSTDQLPPDESLDVVKGVLTNWRTDLSSARSLSLPPEFKQSQLLLEQTLQLRVAQQKEMVVSAKQRYNNPLAGWGGSFQRGLAIGKQARSSAKQFLAVYGAARHRALGTSPSTLPDSF
jgi:hypothetical protein